jgi:hypothetical protein
MNEQETQPPCGRCGGPHRFDTSVDSVAWNRVIRAQTLPEYLCLSCIVLAFVAAGETALNATLWGEGLDGVAVAMRFKGT